MCKKGWVKKVECGDSQEGLFNRWKKDQAGETGYIQISK